jgi:hypothetical protein
MLQNLFETFSSLQKLIIPDGIFASNKKLECTNHLLIKKFTLKKIY